jgi:hypothetical protein
MQVKITIQTLTAALLTLGLGACGGGAPEGPNEARVQAGALADAGHSTIANAADPIAPLLDDEGNFMPSPPQAIPADAAARTRVMRYASAAQADALEHGRQGGVLRVNVGGSGADAVETSVQNANGMQVASNLGHDALVFVDGADLRSAAAVADRLAEQGMTRVWLVTQ